MLNRTKNIKISSKIQINNFYIKATRVSLGNLWTRWDFIWQFQLNIFWHTTQDLRVESLCFSIFSKRNYESHLTIISINKHSFWLQFRLHSDMNLNPTKQNILWWTLPQMFYTACPFTTRLQMNISVKWWTYDELLVMILVRLEAQLFALQNF